MFNSTFASLVDQAVNDCITFGHGREVRHLDTESFKTSNVAVVANWTDDEESIEVAVYENQVLRFSYIEKIPEEHR